MEHLGKLYLNLIEARSSDPAAIPVVLSTGGVYCIATLGQDRVLTPAAQTISAPSWRHEAVLNIEAPVNNLAVQVWEKAEGTSDADKLLGEVTVAIDRRWNEEPVDSWYRLVGDEEKQKSGRRISFTHKKKNKNPKLTELRLKIQYVRYKRFISFFFEDSFLCATLLCFLSSDDKLAQALLALARSQDSAVELVKHIMDREVDQFSEKDGSETATLLRSNNMATIMLIEFCRMFGMGYLSSTLKSLVTRVCQHPGTIEIDPLKLLDSNDRAKNIQELRKSTNEFLSTILSSLDSLPDEFRVVWQHLHKKVKQYFPDSALKLVGGFLFLRFFCPAILAPHNFGLVDEPPCPEAQRHLTLVTKTLQNLANGMRFGTKEPYMEPMNVLVDEQAENVINFFKAIMAKEETERTWDLSAAALDVSMEKAVKIEHLDCIVMHTSKHLVELTQTMPEAERASLLAEADLKFIPLIKLREDQLKNTALRMSSESVGGIDPPNKEKKSSKGAWLSASVKKKEKEKDSKSLKDSRDKH